MPPPSANMTPTDAIASLLKMGDDPNLTDAQRALIKPHVAYINALIPQPPSRPLATIEELETVGEDEDSHERRIKIILSIVEMICIVVPDIPEEIKLEAKLAMPPNPASGLGDMEWLKTRMRTWKEEVANMEAESTVGKEGMEAGEKGKGDSPDGGEGGDVADLISSLGLGEAEEGGKAEEGEGKEGRRGRAKRRRVKRRGPQLGMC